MEKHISSQFDADLTNVSSRLLELGGLVESQTRHAVYALAQFSAEVADQVIATEKQVNTMEVEIDAELASIIARRQPTARDLRLLIAISKTTANLERVGDEAEKIARMVRSIIQSGAPRSLPSLELRVASDLASGLLNKALDAFARLGKGQRCKQLRHAQALEVVRHLGAQQRLPRVLGRCLAVLAQPARQALGRDQDRKSVV